MISMKFRKHDINIFVVAFRLKFVGFEILVIACKIERKGIKIPGIVKCITCDGSNYAGIYSS